MAGADPGRAGHPDSADPAEVIAAGEGLRLALIAGLQYLAPRQRAVLLLREVLGFPAAEVAEMLGVSTAAVKSALQRGLARLGQAAPSPGRLVEPADPRAREQLALYIAGFEHADLAALDQRAARRGRLPARRRRGSTAPSASASSPRPGTASRRSASSAAARGWWSPSACRPRGPGSRLWVSSRACQSSPARSASSAATSTRCTSDTWT